jgi:hypothetical protein
MVRLQSRRLAERCRSLLRVFGGRQPKSKFESTVVVLRRQLDEARLNASGALERVAEIEARAELARTNTIHLLAVVAHELRRSLLAEIRTPRSARAS